MRLSWEKKVDLDPNRIAGIAVSQPVIFDADIRRHLAQDAYDSRLGSCVHLIHQAADGPPDKVAARPKNVERNKDGEDGIKVKPPGQDGQAQADNDAKACPAVREDMLTIGLQDQ